MMTVNYYNKIASSFAPGYVKKRKVRLFTNMLILFHHLHVQIKEIATLEAGFKDADSNKNLQKIIND